MVRVAWLLAPAAALISACGPSVRTQYQELARADSLRADSIRQIQSAMLDEVTSSAQFVNDLNTEMGKLKVPPTLQLSSRLSAESAVSDMRAERGAVTQRLVELVARFDSSQARVASLRDRATRFARQDSTLARQIAEYESTVSTLRSTFDQERGQLQATIGEQGVQIASLTSRIDTMRSQIDTVTQANTQLTTQSVALADTVSQLTTEKNVAFYVVGTKAELLQRGIVVEEGPRRFLVVGSRSLEPARQLDSASFTQIDRLHDRVITLPSGDYTVLSRQDMQYTTPAAVKGSKIAGSLTIDQPEKFWEASKFLVLLKN